MDRAIGLLERQAELEVDKEKLRTELTAEYLRQIVEETRVMAEFNRAKLSFPWFWDLRCYVSRAARPVVDRRHSHSIFMFPWDVADLPTQEMKDAAARTIEWVFYVGGGVAGAKALIR